MGRLDWDKPSVTIRTEFFKPEKGRYLHPVEHRPITHAEAALIQGFPEWFVWCGTKASIARQIGNAVPVPLARAIAEHIGGYLSGYGLGASADCGQVPSKSGAALARPGVASHPSCLRRTRAHVGGFV